MAEADAGRTRGGSDITFSSSLVVAPSDRPNQAVMTLDGFQTDEVIVCDVEASPHELALLFHSYGDGALTNRFGIAQYQVGQRLLTLQRSRDRTAALSTIWQGLKPPEGARKAGFRLKN